MDGPTGDQGAQDTALDAILGYRLRRAWTAVQANLVLSLRDADLRMLTYSALLVIRGRPGLRQWQLADALGIERANCVAVVEELTTRKLIRRETDPTDRRAYALSLTRKGESLIAAAHEVDSDAERRILAALDPDTRHRLHDDLRRLEAAALEVLEARRGS